MRKKPLLASMMALFWISCLHAAGHENVYQKVDNQVVCIRSVLDDQSIVLGSGFFVTPEVVATVAHQVENADKVIVYLADGHQSEAKYLLSKPHLDLALIRVPATRLTGLPLASEAPQLGHEVFTIGCPLGLEHSLSRGVVSHPKQPLEGKELIQTDLTINNGNSGGPLFNQQGQVIGLVMGSWKTATGINFAIPVNHLSPMLAEAGIQPVPPALAALLRQLQENPISAELHSQAAMIYFDQNQLDKARDHYQQALASQPEQVQVLTNLGYVLFKLGEHDQARQRLIQAISINPNFPVAYLNLGMVYANGLNNKNSARQAFAKFLELAPDNPKAKEVRQWLDSHL